MKIARLKAKEVVYANTRFDGNPFNETVSHATMMEASAIQASKKEGKVGIDGKIIIFLHRKIYKLILGSKYYVKYT